MLSRFSSTLAVMMSRENNSMYMLFSFSSMLTVMMSTENDLM